MPKVSTFCPRCGEAIETEVPEEARTAGRAELTCPSCKLEFLIAPAKRPGTGQGAPERGPREEERARWAPGAPTHGRPAPAAEETRAEERWDEGPIRTAPPQVSFKPLAAGLMLVFVAVLGGWTGYELVALDDIEDLFNTMGGTGNLTGEVVGPDGAPVVGANVTILDSPDDNATGMNRTTNEQGAYAYRNVPSGVYTLRFTHPDHAEVTLETLVLADQAYGELIERVGYTDVTMPTEGEPREVSQLDTLRRTTTGIGYGVMALSVLTFAGGVAAMRRRAWPLALASSIAGIFAGFMLVIPAVLAVVSLVLVVLARKEFGAAA